MHKTLQRQLRRATLDQAKLPPPVRKLVELVSDTYNHFDEDRLLIERSLELSSQELGAKNAQLQKELVELKQMQLSNQKLQDVRRATLNILRDLKAAGEDAERSQAYLKERTDELEKFNRLMIGRELKMVELKERIKDLEGGQNDQG